MPLDDALGGVPYYYLAQSWNKQLAGTKIPFRGHEQTGRRPVLIVSTDALQSWAGRFSFVLPYQNRSSIPIHVPRQPPGGVTATSFIPFVTACGRSQRMVDL